MLSILVRITSQRGVIHFRFIKSQKSSEAFPVVTHWLWTYHRCQYRLRLEDKLNDKTHFYHWSLSLSKHLPPKFTQTWISLLVQYWRYAWQPIITTLSSKHIILFLECPFDDPCVSNVILVTLWKKGMTSVFLDFSILNNML